jgi:hypothetical protein
LYFRAILAIWNLLCFARALKLSFLAAVCIIFTLLNISEANAESPFSADCVSSVSAVDFLFDGGSIVFDLSVDRETIFLKFLHPRIPRDFKDKRKTSVLWSFNRQFPKDETRLLDGQSCRILENSLLNFRSQRTNEKLHNSAVGLLLGTSRDFLLKTWGPEAVGYIESGNWAKCFAEPKEPDDPNADPFK